MKIFKEDVKQQTFEYVQGSLTRSLEALSKEFCIDWRAISTPVWDEAHCSKYCYKVLLLTKIIPQTELGLISEGGKED